MPTAASSPNKRRKRVLAIDDEPAMTEWLKMVIEAEGYEVRTALIGTRGEEIFKQWRPDVVVTDLMLPDLDGIQLLRRLKEVDPWPEIIVISGQGTVARAVEAGQAGAFYFLEKPVSQDGLMDMIRKAIDRTQERAEHQQLKEQIRGQYSFAPAPEDAERKALETPLPLLDDAMASLAMVRAFIGRLKAATPGTTETAAVKGHAAELARALAAAKTGVLDLCEREDMAEQKGWTDPKELSRRFAELRQQLGLARATAPEPSTTSTKEGTTADAIPG